MSVGHKCTLWDKAETKEIKNVKRNDSKLLISAKLRTSIKNTDPKLIKLTMHNIRLKGKVSRSGIKKIKFDIGSKFNDLKDDSLSSGLYFFRISQN